MGAFARLSDAVKGARKLEIFIGIALAAAVGLILLANSSDGGGGETGLERRMERTLSYIAGAGDVSVFINEAEDGSITGVLVVAEGAGDMSVRLRLMSAVEAALGVEAARIEITEMEGPV